MIFRSARTAMACVFSVALVGDDEEHLAAVAEAALEEITRVERLLSRFDPAAEIARINRHAFDRPVRIDREISAILQECIAGRDLTDGYFEICRNGDMAFDEQQRTVRFLMPATRLDLGGYGKGYALDRAAKILGEFGVRSALLQAGTSSVVAIGRADDGNPWKVGLRDPFAAAVEAKIATIPLADRGLSSSAVFGLDSLESDLVDPISGARLDRQSACSVVASTATKAEILSTALLAMGRARAEVFVAEGRAETLAAQVAWIDADRGATTIDWLRRRAHHASARWR